jgi:hypothetical protein
MAINAPMPSTQESVMASRKPYDLNEFKTDTTPNTFDACRGIFVDVAGTYKLYFADRPATAMTMILPAGLTQPFSIVKMTASNDAVVAANAIHILY